MDRVDSKWSPHHHLFTITMMVVASLLTAGGIILGMSFKSVGSGSGQAELPLLLKASSASGGEGLSLATGQVDDHVEGIFVLDHLTGSLECWVLNSKNGLLAARYKTNINEDMGIVKTGDADYVMVTGRFDFVGGNRGNLQPGRSICYVADGSSGKVVGYGLRYDQTAANAGQAQSGELFVVAKGLARDVVERDQ